MDRYMMVTRGGNHHLEPSLIGEWVKYDAVARWLDALKLLDARIRGSVASDPLMLHDIIKAALNGIV